MYNCPRTRVRSRGCLHTIRHNFEIPIGEGQIVSASFDKSGEDPPGDALGVERPNPAGADQTDGGYIAAYGLCKTMLQVLQQAGTAMIAQANQLPQSVLKLGGNNGQYNPALTGFYARTIQLRHLPAAAAH